MSAPLLSVVMPLFDGSRYVAEAIESVIAQSYRPLELIVVDDGSTDDGVDVVRRYVPPVRLFTQAHEGCGSARNRGVREARGAYLAFCDADDRFPPDRFERQVAALEREPGLDAAFGEISEFVSSELDERAVASLRAPAKTRPARMMISMLVRKDAFLRIGPFGTDLGRGLELDWLARADDLGLRIEPCEGVVVHRRLHDRSTGMRRRGDEGDYLRAARLVIARRRQPP